jgi:hypothetical protein
MSEPARYTQYRAAARRVLARMADDEVFPHELRLGDEVQIAGAEWRVTSRPRTRPGGKSVEVALEHAAKR